MILRAKFEVCKNEKDVRPLDKVEFVTELDASDTLIFINDDSTSYNTNLAGFILSHVGFMLDRVLDFDVKFQSM